MLPMIDFQDTIELDQDQRKTVRDILQRLFSDCQRVVVEKRFLSDSYSGSLVLLVYRMSDDSQPSLPVVVKVASTDLITREWRAFNEHIKGKWPKAAEIRHEPVSAPDGCWSGLYYHLEGHGISLVESLRSYCQEEATTAEDVRFVVERFHQFCARGLLIYAQKELKHRLRATYDRLLPVNLALKPVSPTPGVKPVTIAPDNLPSSPLEPGDWVRLEGFVVTELDPDDCAVTLNLPCSMDRLPGDSYRVRLRFESCDAMEGYEIGQLMPPTQRIVQMTRDSLWKAEMENILGDPEFDLKSKTVRLPNEAPMPNPFMALRGAPNQFRSIQVGHIHGDLNLGNFLVDRGVHDYCLIDFAEARWDYILHDFCRLETEVLTRLIAPALAEGGLSEATIYQFYEQLHCATFDPDRIMTAPELDSRLYKPFAILKTVRELVRDYGLFDPKKHGEYYECLTVHLLSALKWPNLNRTDDDSRPWPKEVAFWGAASIQQLLKKPPRPKEAWRPTWKMVLVIALATLVIGLGVYELVRHLWPPSPEPPLAILADFTAQVKVKRAGAEQGILGAFAMPLYRRDEVHTYDDATATVLCPGILMYRMKEFKILVVECENPDDPSIEVVRLDRDLVGQLQIVPVGGMDVSLRDETRALRSEQGQAPLLLYPRNSTIADTRPTFHWQALPGATAYWLTVIAPGGQSWHEQASDTSLPYPADKPSLKEGSAYVIRLETLDKPGTVDETVLQVLGDADLVELAKAEAAVENLVVGDPSQRYLLAQLFQQHGMWSAAIKELKQLTAEEDINSAYLYQQLGDLYAEVGLYVQAEESYHRALNAAQSSEDKSAEAASHVGLAQTAYVFGESEQVVSQLDTAEDLYRQAGEEDRARLVAKARAELTD